ncbi:ATP-binding protein [Ktedonosporobacter rubrisoli]|nr:ATP-binding protein [Ktedonosporobacter rubrisoli]
MSQEESTLFTLPQAAAFLGVHPSTIRRWIRSKQLHGQRLGARGSWRFTREALLQVHSYERVADDVAQIEVPFPAKQSISQPASALDFLAGGGEMGELIRAKDWSQTPLGPAESWPQSLKTVVRIMLTSRQPIWIGWGPELIKLYNDPYKAIVGGKHPQALGQPAAVVWREIWDAIGPRLQTAMNTNEGTYDEALLLLMERYGYPEETYYTFSYSPVPGDHGGVGGIICANTADTERILGERQLKLLQTLAAETMNARTIAEACQLCAHSLRQNRHDLPFALLYLLDREQQAVTLAGTSGIATDHPIVPQRAKLSVAGSWPFAEVVKTQQPGLVSLPDQLVADLPTGAWQQPPRQAVVVPIASSGQQGQAGVLIVGLNPFRRFDEGYRGFLTLVAGQIAASIGSAQAYEEERKRAEALAALDHAKTLFFSNVSHEFRTPLTLLLGPIEEVRDDPTTLAHNRERIETAHRNALRLLKLVNTLLDFSRLEAGRVQACYEPTDASSYTAELASTFRSAIEKAGMELLIDAPPLSEPIFLDHDMWEKIVFNLLSNAFKYTFEGSIALSIRENAERVVLTVRDTGVGIAPAHLPHIFDRFQRVEGVKARSHEGSGIGLALVQELVKLHQGTIEVASTVDKGTTFTITIPKGSAHLPKERLLARRTMASTAMGAPSYLEEVMQWLPAEKQSALIASEAAGTGSELVASLRDRPRIVLADDNADMREYIKRLLRDHFEVETVANGALALQAIQKQCPDLVLADVMMPEMDGFQLLAALKADPNTSRVPVLLLSARAGEEATVEGVQAGADDYLVKPFSARELFARVTTHAQLARSRYEAEQQLHDLFMQAPAAVVILRGPNHVIELANPTTLKIWGRSREDVLHKPLFVALPEVRGQGLEPLLEGVYRDGVPYIGQELKVALDRHGDGALEDVYFTFVYTPLRGVNRVIEGIMVFAYDVSAQVLARQKMEELVRQKDEFIGIASHELKTPVTSIKAYTQLLERRFRRAGDEQSATLLKKMDAQVQKLTDLIGDLLDATRIESGKLLFRCSPFDFNELVKEIIEETQRTTSRHTIIHDLAPSVVLQADRERIGQVITNLLTNAIKYSPQAETIRIKTWQEDGELITSVQDFGIGISAEKQAHLFERFYRVDGENQVTYPGLGLGLYISAEFVKRHEGSIWVESEEGKGSTFLFSLPLTPTALCQESVTMEQEGRRG